MMSVVVTGRLDFLIQTCTCAGQPLGRPVEFNAGRIACSSGLKQSFSSCDDKIKGAPSYDSSGREGYVAIRQLVLGVYRLIYTRHVLRSIVFGR